MMQIAFVHTAESHDRIHIERADGSVAGWRWAAGGPPHDLIHWVVESELELVRGFWGLVAGGADFGFHTAAHQGRRVVGIGDSTELTQAEGCVNGIQMAIGLEPRISDAECLSLARRACERAGVELPSGLDQRRYGEVRAAAEEWIARYSRLDPRQALRVSWDAHP